MDSRLRREYTAGEKRRIDWEITPNRPDDTVVITEARYEIYPYGSSAENDLIKSGTADVDGANVGFLFEGDKKGAYLVKLFVTVPPETAETELLINVR